MSVKKIILLIALIKTVFCSVSIAEGESMYSDFFKREYVAKSQKIIGNMIITEDNQEFISLYV